MSALILGLLLFFATHSARIFAEDTRTRLIARHGLAKWKLAYSLASAIGLALIVWGYGQARLEPVPLWVPPLWTRHLASLLTLPAFVLVAAAYVPGTASGLAVDVGAAKNLGSDRVGSSVDMGAAKGIGAHWGRVTSTYRSAAHNRRVGGVANSYHLRNRAIDIARRPGVAHWQIAAAFRAAGYNLLESLDEGDHSHFAFAGPNDRRQFAAAPPPPPPPVPEPPRYPPVLADEHGTLKIDTAPAGALAGR